MKPSHTVRRYSRLQPKLSWCRLSAGSFALLLALSAASAQPSQPNVIYIMTDDHTTQAFESYGSRLAGLAPCPTIDQLGKEGMIFTNAFCTNAICTPSRATILTGQYSKTNGVLDLEGKLPAERQFLPQEFSKLGYQTAVIGKWHLHDEPSAFDHYQVLIGQGTYFDPEFLVRGDKAWGKNKIQRKGHSSDCITDLSLEWLKTGRDHSKPFFLMHQFKAPHDMFEFAPRYADYLKDTNIPEPASLYDDPKHGSVATKGENGSLSGEIGSSVSHRNKVRNMGQHMDIDPSIPDPEYRHLAYQEYLKRYLRCVKGVDDNIKRLLDYLKAESLLDNTIIVYTSDQGFFLGEHDLIDKRWMYDEAMRMPLMVRYPKLVKAGSRSDALVNNTDFAPTLIELAGGKPPGKMQGRSFKGILETGREPADWRQATYYRYWMHMAHNHAVPAHFGIRTKTDKLIFFYGRYWEDLTGKPPSKAFGNRYTFNTPAGWEYYDLKRDPAESHNRYDDPSCKPRIEKLKSDLAKIRETYSEEDHDRPHIQAVIEKSWNP